MAKLRRELPVPPDVDSAIQSIELLRGWLIDNQLQCSLFPTAFDDPAVWGMLLADVAHHIANALAEDGGFDHDTALRAIRRKFTDEMRAPSDEHFGEFVDRKPSNKKKRQRRTGPST